MSRRGGGRRLRCALAVVVLVAALAPAVGCGRTARSTAGPSRSSVATTTGATTSVSAPSTSPPLDPLPAPGGHRLFGLISHGADDGVPAAAATASQLGHSLDLVNVYSAWSYIPDLPTATLQHIATAGATPEITWEPWNPAGGLVQPAYALARIAAGDQDAYVRRWAAEAAAYGKPILLRFAHEMNGTTYPWSAVENGGSAAAYVAAYRHVHALFAAAGATNVRWVWSPNVVRGLSTSLASLYPGDDVVDVVGVDGYNFGTDAPDAGGWTLPEPLFASTLAQIATFAPTEPVLVNETGSSEDGGDKAAWITALFAYLETQRQVIGVVWFDVSKAGEPDWRIDTSAASEAAFAQALKSW